MMCLFWLDSLQMLELAAPNYAKHSAHFLKYCRFTVTRIAYAACEFHPQQWFFYSCRTSNRHSSVSTSQMCLFIISHCSWTFLKKKTTFYFFYFWHLYIINQCNPVMKVKEQMMQRSILARAFMGNCGRKWVFCSDDLHNVTSRIRGELYRK